MTTLNNAVSSAMLQDVLVLSVHKGFWASGEARIFPNRRYTKRLMGGGGRWGSSRNPINNVTLMAEALAYIARKKPKIVLIGSAIRTVPWFANLKRSGLLASTKLVATTQSYLSDQQVAQLDRVIIYSTREVQLRNEGVRSKYTFIPLPAEGPFDEVPPASDQGYIFSGGGAGRDFTTLIEAVRGIDIPLKLVTFSRASLGYTKALPNNVEVEWRMPPREFLKRMAGCRFVIVPLQEGDHPHGHTTGVQALRMGKPVITTQNASMDDYIKDGEHGLLVPPSDVNGYRDAISKLYHDEALLRHCQQNALKSAHDLTYSRYAEQLALLCQDVRHENL